MKAPGISVQQAEERTKMSAARFIFGFESLGETCEFGLMQRRCGADPASLFRFAFCPLNSLIHGLQTRFADFGLPANLEIGLAEDGPGEYIIRDKALSTEFHTQIYKGSSGEALLLTQYVSRLAFLRRKLMTELEAGKKIFVWNGGCASDEYQASALCRAINACANNILLWIAQPDLNHRAGTVEQIAPGLVKGYLDPLAPGEDITDARVALWLEVCVETYRALRQADLPIAPSSFQRVSINGGKQPVAWSVSRPIRLMAHIENRGDTESDPEGWVGILNSRLAIEGIVINDIPEIPPEALTYRVLLDNSTFSDPGFPGEFRGTRGLGRPVFGIEISVPEEFVMSLHITCEAQFVDGTIIGPVAAGILCKAHAGAALAAVRVMMRQSAVLLSNPDAS